MHHSEKATNKNSLTNSRKILHDIVLNGFHLNNKLPSNYESASDQYGDKKNKRKKMPFKWGR